jgi:zinc finger-containing ubiquitin peptidase 1
MPNWLHRQLESGGKISRHQHVGSDGKMIEIETVENEISRIVKVLGKLCEQDQSVETAYLCHPAVQYIGKIKNEGNFCGYRNIQMLVSYIRGSQAQGCEDFLERSPSILRLQALIEDAWDKGINSEGRLETGGILGTRKYIGTPEVG